MILNPVINQLNEPDLSPGTVEVAEIAVSKCGFNKKDMILDVGCGFGKTTSYLGKRIEAGTVSLDISIENLRRTLEKNNKTNCICADIINLPLIDSIFQGIFCQCVLSLIEDKKRILGQFHRLLKSYGKLVLSDIYLKEATHINFPGKKRITSCLDGAATKDKLIDMLENSGFYIDFFEDKTQLLKQMAGQIIFDYGSFEAYRLAFSGLRIFPDCTGDTFIKYGYFLIIAGKK